MDRRLPANSIPIFSEGISLVLYSWSALRTAVENECGGRDSRQKAERLGSEILSWFTQSREPLYIDDLEIKLDEGMISLNMEVEDGSIEEVSEKLMILHEECLEGNFRSIEILREANLEQAARSRVIQVVDDNKEEEEEEDDEDRPEDNSNMMVQMQMPVQESMPRAAAEADGDGWTVVSNRRNRGRN